MNRSMITSSVTMGQLQKRLDTIGSNLSNLNTHGYKKRETQFGELLVRQINNQSGDEAKRLTPEGIRVGAGARIGETNILFAQGTVTPTDRPLDVALAKENQLFQIQVDRNGQPEIQYTRNGAFYVTPNDANPAELRLVTGNGDFVMGETGPITIPAGFESITISEDGSITAETANGPVEAGRLQIAEVTRPQLLNQIGDNRFALPGEEELNRLEVQAEDIIRGAENVSIRQGALEASNVDFSKEMTDMVMTQRAYQFNAKSISISDQMMGLINGLR
ncbi:flagellar hook-basal body protein [Bacillus marinisedimentorum]|uniref:flagellar hook-basal body protein n=1 Tax=Bacillus marinisedimentorum TaxID=1821260 RepID=UPI0007E16080|nr:flagellar hook-basal body protein [Bacillus marinisedimentorum]